MQFPPDSPGNKLGNWCSQQRKKLPKEKVIRKNELNY